jgi:arginine N-succinyltransferase
MLRIRPVRPDDHADILSLATIAGVGMSSLPQDANVLDAKIRHSVESFASDDLGPQSRSLLFALEDMETKRLAGTTGIVTHVGLKRPFYSYKLSTITQASSGVGIYSLQHVLHMVNDYTGAAEVGSLFLLPEYRRDGIGRFLSRCRYLVIAEFASLFSDTIISEIRGVQDADGHSPFYDHLARHFFQMDFKQADYIYATQGSQFIADLMPKYPIYTNLLAPEAQAVIGVPMDASRPAMQLLQAEGFRYEGYVDLFDAGPTLQVARRDIRTVRKSRRAEVRGVHPVSSDPVMICNTRLADFHACSGCIEETQNGVIITPEAADALGVTVGDMVRYAA